MQTRSTHGCAQPQLGNSFMGTLNIELVRGTTMDTVIITLSDETTGDPIDLTGATYISLVKDTNYQTVVDLAPTTYSALDGKFKIALTDEQSTGLVLGVHLWDVIVELSSGVVLPPVYGGTFTITKSTSLG